MFKKFWNFLGTSDCWLALALIIFFSEIITGMTIAGALWLCFCITCFFLSRIACALEVRRGT